ncbi:hypothetical protein M569_04901, partial [Genlisea aurea]
MCYRRDLFMELHKIPEIMLKLPTGATDPRCQKTIGVAKKDGGLYILRHSVPVQNKASINNVGISSSLLWHRRLETKEIFHSRDVIFYESEYPFLTDEWKKNEDFLEFAPVASPFVGIPEEMDASHSSLDHDSHIIDDDQQLQSPTGDVSDPVPLSTDDVIPDAIVSLRRSSRGRQPPAYLKAYECNFGIAQDSAPVPYSITNYISDAHLGYSYRAFIGSLDRIVEPRHYVEASTMPEWKAAMESELSALNLNDTWDLEIVPQSQHVVGCKWVYK